MTTHDWAKTLLIVGNSLEILGVGFVALTLSLIWRSAADGQPLWPALHRLLHRGHGATVRPFTAHLTGDSSLTINMTAEAAGHLDMEDRLTQIERRAIELERETRSGFAGVNAALDRLRDETAAVRLRIEALQQEAQATKADDATFDVRSAIPGLIVTTIGLLLEVVSACIGG